MRSRRSQRFKRLYAALPAAVRDQADETCRLWKSEPRHPGLHFRPVDPADSSVYSIRIGLHYRAIGAFQPNGDFLWLWIGSHAEYDQRT